MKYFQYYSKSCCNGFLIIINNSMYRKSPAGFTTLEVTAEVRINIELQIRLLNVLVKRKVITRQFQFQREIYGLPVISLPTQLYGPAGVVIFEKAALLSY